MDKQVQSDSRHLLKIRDIRNAGHLHLVTEFWGFGRQEEEEKKKLDHFGGGGINRGRKADGHLAVSHITKKLNIT
jgi:D-lyxose ketol-isomerase